MTTDIQSLQGDIQALQNQYTSNTWLENSSNLQALKSLGEIAQTLNATDQFEFPAENVKLANLNATGNAYITGTANITGATTATNLNVDNVVITGDATIQGKTFTQHVTDLRTEFEGKYSELKTQLQTEIAKKVDKSGDVVTGQLIVDNINVLNNSKLGNWNINANQIIAPNDANIQGNTTFANDISVLGNSKLGDWNVRSNRMGITGVGDITLGQKNNEGVFEQDTEGKLINGHLQFTNYADDNTYTLNPGIFKTTNINSNNIESNTATIPVLTGNTKFNDDITCRRINSTYATIPVFTGDTKFNNKLTSTNLNVDSANIAGNLTTTNDITCRRINSTYATIPVFTGDTNFNNKLTSSAIDTTNLKTNTLNPLSGDRINLPDGTSIKTDGTFMFKGATHVDKYGGLKVRNIYASKDNKIDIHQHANFTQYIATPQANVGKWRIKDDRMGISGYMDMHWDTTKPSTDRTIRFPEYGQTGHSAHSAMWLRSVHGDNRVSSSNNIEVSGKGIKMDSAGKLHAKSAKIANWEIRNDRMGIPNKADITQHSNTRLHINQYGTTNFEVALKSHASQNKYNKWAYYP